jgi:serpin B
MKIILMLLIGLNLISPSWAQVQGSEDGVSTAKSVNDFGLDLYSKLKIKSGNIFISPYSISTALGMAYAGAKGDTAKEMAKVLHFSLPHEKQAESMAELMRSVQPTSEDSYTLMISNALWGQKGFGFLPQFLDILKKYYGAGLEEVDFAKDTEGSRIIINQWVEENTKQRIKDLIKSGMLSGYTRLVLTNAVYFKGIWQDKFEKTATSEQDFYDIDQKILKVSMMNNSKSYKYFENDSLQVLELPYKGDKISMLVLLPKEKDGVINLGLDLNAENLDIWLKGLSETEVNVYLPKFELEYDCNLSDILINLGMAQAFSQEQADFSGMNGKGWDSPQHLILDKVIHKAWVKVDEEGTEAAAATAVVMMTNSISVAKEPKQFKADHPFIFIIHDNPSGAILFIGRVMNPA